MIDYRYVGDQGTKKLEVKTGWVMGTLTQPQYFVHGSGLSPREVKQKLGFSPEHAREYLIDAVTRAPVNGGKMLFAFPAAAGGQVPANVRRTGAVKNLWGSGGHVYVFEAPVGKNYWCTGGNIGIGMETAFPYIIELSDLRLYIPPNETQNIPWKAATLL